jgi:hypothetical protein
MQLSGVYQSNGNDLAVLVGPARTPGHFSKPPGQMQMNTFSKTLGVTGVGLVVLVAPLKAMSLKPHHSIVWIDYDAMLAADRLIEAGVNTREPDRLHPFVACIREPGTPITVVRLHTLYDYAEVDADSGASRCAGVVHLGAIDTGLGSGGNDRGGSDRPLKLAPAGDNTTADSKNTRETARLEWVAKCTVLDELQMLRYKPDLPTCNGAKEP